MHGKCMEEEGCLLSLQTDWSKLSALDLHQEDLKALVHAQLIGQPL